MFCENCGTKLEDDAKTCQNCGKVINPEQAQKPEPQIIYVEKRAKISNTTSAMIFIIIAFYLAIWTNFSDFNYLFLLGFAESAMNTFATLNIISLLTTIPFAIIAFIKSLQQDNKAIKLVGILTFVYCVSLFMSYILGLFTSNLITGLV